MTCDPQFTRIFLSYVSLTCVQIGNIHGNQSQNSLATVFVSTAFFPLPSVSLSPIRIPVLNSGTLLHKLATNEYLILEQA